MPGRPRHPLAVALRAPYPWSELAGLARAIEAAGYAALFPPEVGTRDTLVAPAALAGRTTTLPLGTRAGPPAGTARDRRGRGAGAVERQVDPRPRHGAVDAGSARSSPRHDRRPPVF